VATCFANTITSLSSVSNTEIRVCTCSLDAGKPIKLEGWCTYGGMSDSLFCCVSSQICRAVGHGLAP